MMTSQRDTDWTLVWTGPYRHDPVRCVASGGREANAVVCLTRETWYPVEIVCPRSVLALELMDVQKRK